jgi:serine/threonine protein kinase
MFEDSKNVYMVGEVLKGADLIAEFSENTRITEGKCALIIYQILEAITYLHSKGLAHNNISGQAVQLVA